MPAANLLTLLDDIVSVLDDVAAMTKVATSKTAGVLGDDLALNAQQVAGVNPERELPVILKVARGSFLNKLILVPSALLISFFLPWLISPLLMLGGAFLCYEGVEKIFHKFFAPKEEELARKEHLSAVANPKADLCSLEQDKIKGAIRTDFILSAEIIVISLGTVATQGFLLQFGVLATVAIIMTLGVYGLVAGIIKLDDFGLWLLRKARSSRSLNALVGRSIIWFAPVLLRLLSFFGTLAMFLVGGGIIVHGLPYPMHLSHEQSFLIGQALNLGVGALLGIVVLLVVSLIQTLRSKIFSH